MATPSPAQAASSDVVYACYGGGSAPTIYSSTTSPSRCNGIYRIQKNGVTVVQIDRRRVKDWNGFVKSVRALHGDANRWCSTHALDCTVLAGIGITLLAPLLVANS
ncbi:hypothetical protein AS850_14010 [Frondihabitans sp. 762G35]|nr:hypothetical protein AS850_14010 [Frondihabitans sp. 762G35]